MVLNLKPIKFGSNNFCDLWDTWRFTREQKNSLLLEIKAVLSCYTVYEYLGGQLYRGGEPQSTHCCVHPDSRKSAKVTDDYYKCYAGCGGGDVIWLLREGWDKIGYGLLIKKADKIFGLELRDDPEVAKRVMSGGAVRTKRAVQIGDGEVMDRMKVNRVYQAILEYIPFLDSHKKQFMEKRNLPEDVIEAMVDRGYRSYELAWEMDLVNHLSEKLGLESFGGVPGFYRDSTGPWRFHAPSGVIFPVTDISGLMTALLVRSDQDWDKKYSYVSSVNLPRGTKANYGFHVIRNGRSFKHIWVVEGILKADVVSIFMKGSGLVCGLPSLSGGRTGLLDLIKQFKGSSVYLCMDSDWRSKPAVKRGVTDLAKSICRGLSKHKHSVSMVNWDPAVGKGMDDVLANVGKKALDIKNILNNL